MLNIVCDLLGHHRSKRRVRPTVNSWRSPCHLCGTQLERIAPGRWMAVADLPRRAH